MEIYLNFPRQNLILRHSLNPKRILRQILKRIHWHFPRPNLKQILMHFLRLIQILTHWHFHWLNQKHFHFLILKRNLRLNHLAIPKGIQKHFVIMRRFLKRIHLVIHLMTLRH